VVTLGVDRLLHEPGVSPGWVSSGRRLGLLTSRGAMAGPAAAASTTLRALLDAGVPLVRLFSPEHGLSAQEGDGVPVSNGVDGRTGLPVVSLYGRKLTPPPETLADLDGVLVDIQDVGVRFYTYARTMQHLMVSCAENRVPLGVLDRPNPLGGKPKHVEGPLPDPGLPTSFLCPWSFPVRHSLTLGEMALLLREEMNLTLDLTIVGMEGWKREMFWPDTGLPFHPPSPGLPGVQGVFFYPGLALLEATNVHEGRGTPLSFQWFGAPWMDGERVAAALEGAGLPGMSVRALALEGLELPGRTAGEGGPAGPPHSGHPGRQTGPENPVEARAGQHPEGGARRARECPGVFLEARDPGALRPVAAGLRILALLRTLFPGDFSWQAYPTWVNPSGESHLLHLLRSRGLVRLLEEEPERLLEGDLLERQTRAPGWWERARPFLLYS